MPSDDYVNTLYPEVRAVAEQVAHKWRDVATADDLEQDIWVRLLESDYAQKLAQFDKQARGATLARIANQVADKQRLDYDHFTGNFRYSANEVRVLLKNGVLTEERVTTRTERLDLDEATAMLRERNPRYAEVIYKKYVSGETIDARHVLTRAVDKLTECMNSVHNGRMARNGGVIGNRKVISSTRARIQTAIQETGHEGR